MDVFLKMPISLLKTPTAHITIIGMYLGLYVALPRSVGYIYAAIWMCLRNSPDNF